MTDQQIRIAEHGTAHVVIPLTSLPAGVHRFRVHTEGNALLASVYVKTSAGPVTVRWFDYGASSTDTDPGAELTLLTHPALSGGQKSRRIVSHIHNNVHCEVTVAGGAAEIGVIASVVGDFPLFFDDIPLVDPSGPGRGIVLEASGALAIAPQAEAALLTAPVPIGNIWRLRYVEIACRGYGSWRCLVDGARVAGGLTGAPRDHDRVELPPKTEATEGQVVEVLYTYGNGPAAMPIETFIGLTEI